MIFVTVGASFPFDRLIKYIDEEIAPLIDEEIVAQIHYGASYIPSNIKYYEMLEKKKFNKFVKNSDLVITHAGLGVIIDCINNQKKCIIVPRDPDLGEHIDNHQYEICDYLKKHYSNLLIDWELFDLKKWLTKQQKLIKKSVVEKRSENLKNLKKRISNYIDDKIKNEGRIFIVCSPGGHLRQVQEYIEAFPKNRTTVITYKTDAVLEGYDFHVIPYYAPIVSDESKLEFYKFLYHSFREAFSLIKKHRPVLIFTNGGGELAVPFAYMGKVFDSKIMFLETVSRVSSKSDAAKMLYPIADTFLIQWKKNLENYGNKAEYWGSVI